jgi:hypothetical protein
MTAALNLSVTFWLTKMMHVISVVRRCENHSSTTMTKRTGNDGPGFLLCDRILEVTRSIRKQICGDYVPRHRGWFPTACDQGARDELAHLTPVKVLSK